jgi:GNAT superfamily N-acetyltransferase
MPHAVRQLDARATAAEVTEVLCEAFAEYPVMRYVLGRPADYGERIRILIGFFVTCRVFREDAILGIYAGDELRAAALCSLPDRTAPPELERIREGVWALLGPDARVRYDDCVRAWALIPDVAPNVHVNMLAVPPRYQGRGLARALMDRVHAMSRDRADSHGVSLTTESESNVALYQHLGYRIVGEATIAPGVRTWGFFRPD